jgi:hypothetical protein
MSRAGLKGRVVLESEVCGVRVCGDTGVRSMVRKPLVGRVALEGLTIERTGAAAALGRETRAAAVHRRGARAALCNQPLKLLTAFGARRAQRCAGAGAAASEQSAAVTVLT